MVLKHTDTCAIVIEHRSVRIDPCDAKLIRISRKINIPYVNVRRFKIMRIFKKLCTDCQVASYLLLKQTIIYDCNSDCRRKNCQNGNPYKAQIDLFFHSNIYPTFLTVLILPPEPPSFCRNVLICISSVLDSPSYSMPQILSMIFSRLRTMPLLIIK